MCKEYVRLLEVYQKAVALYSTTLNAMEVSIGTTPQHEYQRTVGYVEQSRLRSEQARIALEKHKTEHGCMGTAT
jgi:hypothetical protein